MGEVDWKAEALRRGLSGRVATAWASAQKANARLTTIREEDRVKKAQKAEAQAKIRAAKAALKAAKAPGKPKRRKS